MDNSKNSWSVTVDKDLRPAYYDRFRCLAAGCKLSCCIGWGIAFNKKDYLSLKRQTGSPELEKRMDQALRRVRGGKYEGRMYGEFFLPDGVCPLLQEDCLCALQAEKGLEALPQVCRRFPRGESYLISGYLERSLSLACEGVLALLWDLPEGVDFLSDPLPRDAQRRLMVSGETVLCRHFAEMRELCVDFLQDRRLPLPERILMMGMALRELAEGETDVSAWLVRSRALADGMASGGLPEEEPEKLLVMFLSQNIQTLGTICTENPDLRELKAHILANCGISSGSGGHASISLKPYCTAKARFEENFGERAYFFENLMVALLFMLNIPNPVSPEALWKSYVNLCSLYAFYRFMAVMSCREGAGGDREELFRSMVFVGRALLHSGACRTNLRDEFFQNDSATLAHMAVLLSG